jgi:dUTP diphosphatase
MKIKIKKLHPDAVIPKYAHAGDSGFDFVALEDIEVCSGETVLVKTGIAIAVPDGYELQVRPRSGTSLKTPLRVSNSPGTVDAGFRNEICVIITNTSTNHYKAYRYEDTSGCVNYTIKKGERVAQGVICPVVRVNFEEVEELDDTVRGMDGFGSSGQ